MRALDLAALGLAAVTLTACLSLDRPPPSKRRYLLEATRPQEAPAASSNRHLVVPTFHVLPAWTGPGFVHRVAGGAIEVDPQAELFVAPGPALAEITRRWLFDAGLFAAVSGEGSRVPATHWLEGDVLELSVDSREAGATAAVLEVEFVLLDRDRRVVHRARLGHETPLTDTDPARIVAAWNEAIAAVMGELEAGLREQLRGDAAK